MEFDIYDKRDANCCNQVKGQIVIQNDRVELKTPDNSVLVHISTNGEVFFDPERWGSNYKLRLMDGYTKTYQMEKKC